MKLAFRNTDKTKLPGNELMGHLCMASGRISNTVTVMDIITVTRTVLTSGNSTKECHYTKNLRFLFGWTDPQ